MTRDMVNFDFIEKGLGINIPRYFGHDFSRKMFLMFYSVNCLVAFIMYNVIKFEINLIFRIKLFFYLTKKSSQKLKCENKEGIFYHF